MVDKIDRPEAPAPWRIKETGRTKDDRPSQQQQESKEKKKEKFEKRAVEGTWQKFDTRTMVIRPVSVPLHTMKGILFRNVTMHSGMVTLEGDLQWADGRVTEGALIRLAGFEEYMRAKRLRAGAEVPRELWAKGDTVEVGIPQERGHSGSFAIEEIEREVIEEREKPRRTSPLALLGLVNKRTGKFQWSMLILYVLVATGLALAIHALLTMTRT